MKNDLYKRFSSGIIAQDIEIDSLYVKVIPYTIESSVNGKINTISEETISNTIPNGEVDELKVVKSDGIICKWLSKGNDNRITCPTVCKGEEVVIYRKGTDDFYWMTTRNELDLRKNEKAIFAFSNRSKLDGELKLDDMYYFGVDTIEKEVFIHLSDSDGEKSGYDISINGKEGRIHIADTHKNVLVFDSVEGKFTTSMVNEIHDDTNIHKFTNRNEIHDIVDKYMVKCKTETHTVSEHTQIDTPTISISNGSVEVVDWMLRLCDAILSIQHYNIVGLPTDIFPPSKKAIEDLKKELGTIKKG